MKSAARIALLCLLQLGAVAPARHASAQNDAVTYPVAAPLDRYFIADRASEIAFARTAAPAAISDAAEVLVLTRNGYESAGKGTNGFVCMVQRSWAAATTDDVFWNPKLRAPICVNEPAARTFLPVILLKTKLVLAGKSKAEIALAVKHAFDTKALPEIETGSMSYMMSRQQYLGDTDKSWHPHLMFFERSDPGKLWGANVHGSPIITASDPENHLVFVFVLVNRWSDGTPAAQMP